MNHSFFQVIFPKFFNLERFYPWSLYGIIYTSSRAPFDRVRNLGDSHCQPACIRGEALADGVNIYAPFRDVE